MSTARRAAAYFMELVNCGVPIQQAGDITQAWVYATVLAETESRLAAEERRASGGSKEPWQE